MPPAPAVSVTAPTTDYSIATVTSVTAAPTSLHRPRKMRTPAPVNPINNSGPQPVVVEESRPAEGMAVRLFSNGDKIINLANGQKEIHCEAFKVSDHSTDGTFLI